MVIYDHKNVSCTVAAILTKVVKTMGSLGDINNTVRVFYLMSIVRFYCMIEFQILPAGIDMWEILESIECSCRKPIS